MDEKLNEFEEEKGKNAKNVTDEQSKTSVANKVTPEEKQAMIDDILSFDTPNSDAMQGVGNDVNVQNVCQNAQNSVKKERKMVPMGTMIAICIATVLLSFVVGVLGGYVYNYDHQSTTVTSVGTFTQQKNTSANVTINEITQDGTVTVANNLSESVANAVDSVVLVKSTLANGTSAGSGVIFGYDGEVGYAYIITNHHVIENATAVKVYTYSGEEYVATLVGASAPHDLAVLKVYATGLKPATLGISSSIKIGEPVFAVGNALGQGFTVSQGIISVKNRNITMDLVRYHLLQTDASINSGNSGGGLFDASGNLIGIVNAKSFGTGIEGLGYAIPIDEAKDVAIKLLQNISGGYGYVPGSVYFGLNVEDYASNNQGYIHITSNVVTDTNTYNVGTSNFSFSSNDYISKIEFGGNSNIAATNLTGANLNCANFIALIEQLEVGDTLTMNIVRLGMFGNTSYEVTVTVNQYIYPN